MADEEVIRFDIEVLAARAGMSVDEFRKKVQQAKADIEALNSTMSGGKFFEGQTPEQIGAALGYDPAVIEGAVNGFNQVGEAVVSVGEKSQQAAPKVQSIRTALGNMFAALKSGQGISQQFSTVFQAMLAGLGSFAIYQAFNAIISGIGQFVGMLDEAAVKSKEFLDAYFKLQVGLRDAQRKGFDATLGDLDKFGAEFQAKYPQFSRTAIVEGMADLIFRTKELGLTSQQAFKLFEAASALATASGKNVGEVLKEIAQAASSGYSEGLQRMGILINKNVITQRTYAEGAKNSAEAMDLQRRATATLNIVLEQTAGIVEDTTAKQKTLAGWADTVAAKNEDATTRLGKAWLPIKTFFSEEWAKILEEISVKLFGVTLAFTSISGAVAGAGAVIADFFSGKFWSGKNVADIIAEDLQKGLDDAYLKAGITMDAFGNEVVEKNAEIFDQFGMTPEQAQKMQTSLDKFYEDILDLTDKYQTDLVNAEEKYQNDLVDIDVQGQRKREELTRNLARKLEEINIDLGRDYQNAQIDYQRDLVNIDIQANRKIEEAQRESAQRKVDIEKKYQDDVKKLQNELIFDLEEAVRTGDVIQIRKLQRQYQKDLANLAIGRTENITTEGQNLTEKIADIERQRAFDKQQRLIDYQQKKEDLDRQAAQERVDANTRYQQELADLRKSLIEQKKERLKAYNDQLTDMYRAFQNRLRLASEALIKEVGLNAQAASAIAGYMVQLYGPSGLFDQVYKYMMSYINSGKDKILKTVSPPQLKTPTAAPTTTTAAPDVGPSKVEIGVTLSPDLQAQIVETSVNTVADIVLRSA